MEWVDKHSAELMVTTNKRGPGASLITLSRGSEARCSPAKNTSGACTALDSEWTAHTLVSDQPHRVATVATVATSGWAGPPFANGCHPAGAIIPEPKTRRKTAPGQIFNFPTSPALLPFCPLSHPISRSLCGLEIAFGFRIFLSCARAGLSLSAALQAPSSRDPPCRRACG